MKTTPAQFVTVLCKSAKGLLLGIVVAFLAYRAEFASASVLGQEVTSGPIVAEVMGTGTLEARIKTTLSPRIQERLAEVLVDQNDTVKAGQLLARLDDGELKMQVEVAEAARVAARASLERVKTDEARALAVDKQARLNHQRVSDLMARQVSSQDELDKAVEALHVAAADVKRSQAAIAEAESQVVTAEKNLAYQKERLSYTQILSPYDGLVVRRDRDPGGVVVPGGSLLQLIATNEIWVSAWVDETAMRDLVTGQPARVIFRSEPEMTYSGEVARLGRQTDRETREPLVDVRVKALPKNWTVGQRAEVFIETGRKSEGVVLPQRFVQWREGKPGVFVSEHGKAKWRAVTLGLRRRETVEITQGVTAGEHVLATREAKQPPLTAIGLINPPTAGRIVIGRQPVMDAERALVDLRAFRRQHLGFVFQKANLIPFLNAVENVQVAMAINDMAPRVARQRALELLDYLGIADRANNLPDALSGGQQQRVAVARALANRPSLILADEPTAALDSHRGRQVMELFRKVAHERGSAVIVVTHDHRSLDVFDRTYEMEDGRFKPPPSQTTTHKS